MDKRASHKCVLGPGLELTTVTRAQVLQEQDDCVSDHHG